MDSFIYDVFLKLPNGGEASGKVFRKPSVLTIEYEGFTKDYSFFDQDLFSAFSLLRQDLWDKGVIILCKGNQVNVYPSRMSRSMGGGVLAYEMKKGFQAKKKDMVNIFDAGEEDLMGTPKEQENFYLEWLESL